MIVNLLTLYFENRLKPYEIPLFRGAIINSLDHKLLLFHNHDGDGYRYAYPLIQYKRLEGKAAILCIGKGVEDVGELLTSHSVSLKMGNHEMDLHVSKAVPQTFDLHIAAQPYTYRIDQWCALNEPNWKRYNEMTGMVERVTFLERILTGNILSFAKGVGWHIEEEIKCKILAIDHAHPRRVKGVNMSCMRLAFQSNAALPDLIGLGKHVSINYGTITRNNQ